MLLCYPAVFQTNSPAAVGLRNLPKHVWTSTTEIEGDHHTDVFVRQVWVHGDYMRALNRSVLRKALDVQVALLNGGFGAGEDIPASIPSRARSGCGVPGLGEKWGWRSPLMYWNCSEEALASDKNILETIHVGSKTQTSMNLTLRPSTVFAGKHFTNAKLQAADALVLTLLDQTGSTDIGEQWNTRARALAQELDSDWIIFPQDAQISSSRLYEFRLKPMSRLDDIFLAGSYTITTIYVILRMMQLRAVKSWFGLLVTVGTKMAICIVASFSLCTWLGVDLARIPRPWFPAVVFCYGLGNIFRLINAVLETPPEMPPQQRIGNALGEVGHLSLAVAFQNLALIYLCSRFVSPWVADFCIFAAVTLVFDFVYHLTFFVAVLSVDVQRMELSDSIGQADSTRNSKKKRKKPGRQSWCSALLEGSTPLSTRFAGTVAIFSVILAINLHFFEVGDQQLSFDTVKKKLLAKRQKRSSFPSWSSPPINQARTPAEWLKLQDHNTARELFAALKPGAHSFIARIYDPILVVTRGAQGRDKPQVPTTLMGYLRRFAQGHTFPAALMAVFMIAGVTLLMNYLLWTGLPEATDDDEEKESAFSVKTLPTQHTLDIVDISASVKGNLTSVSLDRTTSIWLKGPTGYKHTTLQTANMKPKLWPIVASALDDSGTLLALGTDVGRIGLWNITASRFQMFPMVDFRAQVPALFSFINITRNDQERPYIIIVSPDGYLTELEARTGIHRTKRISASAILCAELYVNARGEANLVFVCKPGEVHVLSLQEPNNASSEVVASLDPGPPPDSNPAKVKCIHGVPSLGLIFALRDERAEMFDFNSKALIHAFEIGHIRPHSFRVMHSARRQCPCGASAVHTLSVAYAEKDEEHMILQSFTPDDASVSHMCLGKPLDRPKNQCQGLEHATEAVFCVDSAGVWETAGASSIVGVRRRLQSTPASSAASDDEDDTPIPIAPISAVRQRASKPNESLATSRAFTGSANGLPHTPATDNNDLWEAWTVSVNGEFYSRPLLPDDDDEEENEADELFVVAPGPITRLGKRSVAVGFGNTVKVITLGKEVCNGVIVQNGGLDIGLGSYRARPKRGMERKAL